MSSNVVNNMYSRKVGIGSIAKICVFDQVVFGRANDQINSIIMSTFPRNWKVAVFYRRCL